MAERILRQWDADPNGEMVVKVYETHGVKAAIRSVFQPSRIVDVPSGTIIHLYEPRPIRLRANERIEVIQEGKVVLKG